MFLGGFQPAAMGQTSQAGDIPPGEKKRPTFALRFTRATENTFAVLLPPSDGWRRHRDDSVYFKTLESSPFAFPSIYQIFMRIMFPAYGMGRVGTEFINYPRRFMQILIMQLARCQIAVMASY